MDDLGVLFGNVKIGHIASVNIDFSESFVADLKTGR